MGSASLGRWRHAEEQGGVEEENELEEERMRTVA